MATRRSTPGAYRPAHGPGSSTPLGAIALVGSADLTGRAMADDLECGDVLRGARVAGAIVAHLESLRWRGVLVPA